MVMWVKATLEGGSDGVSEVLSYYPCGFVQTWCLQPRQPQSHSETPERECLWRNTISEVRARCLGPCDACCSHFCLRLIISNGGKENAAHVGSDCSTLFISHSFSLTSFHPVFLSLKAWKAVSKSYGQGCAEPGNNEIVFNCLPPIDMPFSPALVQK